MTMVDSILKDKKREPPCALFTDGEDDACGHRARVPVRPVTVGAGGAERIAATQRSPAEQALPGTPSTGGEERTAAPKFACSRRTA